MGISRRRFLQTLTWAGLGTAVYPLLSRVSKVEAKGWAASGLDPRPTGTKTLTKQWTMVIDLKKCEGCVIINKPPQCTVTCNQGHFVPEGQEWIKVSKVRGAGGGSHWMPFPCMHCQKAPCVDVCPVGASYYTEEGLVLIDQDRCIGCRVCMAACPYHRRYFNWKQQRLTPEAALAERSPEYPVPALKGTVSKCMFCAHNVRKGKIPICVSGCPMGAIYFGDLERDIITNGMEVVPLRKTLAENNAFRFKEELGTEPRVYYLPGYGQEFGREARE